MSKMIVITGMGAVTPLGIGVEAYWNGLISGTSGIGPVTLFNATPDYDVRIAGEVKGFDPGDFMDRREAKRMDRFAQFGVAAAKLALQDAGLEITPENAPLVGVLVGSGIGGLQSLEDQM